MPHAKLLLALSIIAASPAMAGNTQPPATAPAGGPDTRYCMWIAASTGTLVEQVRCLTREQWTRQGVDVNKDWPKEGVRTVG